VNLDGKGGCVDEQQREVPLHCCAEAFDCNEQAMTLSMQCSLRIQAFMQGCQLDASDIETSGASLRLTDDSRLCTSECQTHEALVAADPLVNLDTIKSECAEQIAPTMAIIASLESFSTAWAACRGEVSDGDADTQPSAVLDAAVEVQPSVHDAESPVASTVETQAAKKVRWGNVKITTQEGFLGESVLDSRALFETTWNAIPVGFTDEFKITGTIGAIEEELLLRPNLPVACDPRAIGNPVHLIVQRVRPTTGRIYADALGTGFANIAGLSTFAARAPDLFEVGDDGLMLVKSLATNPSSVSAETAINYLMDKLESPPAGKAKKLWRWFRRMRNTALLTLANPKRSRGGYVGSIAKFQCAAGTVRGSQATAFATWVDGDVRTVVTAKHLAFLITTLA